jgi:hypothetical protein
MVFHAGMVREPGSSEMVAAADNESVANYRDATGLAAEYFVGVRKPDDCR